MTRRSFALARRTAPLALTLALGLVASPAARAQVQEFTPGATQEAEGRPFDGYFVVGILAGAALFAVGKTARR